MSKTQRKSDHCLNCDRSLRPDDNFCPHCGQKNDTHKIPVKHLFMEFVEDLFHFDSKLWNTLKASFTRPGKITLDYLEGKRMRYVPPVKFYVFVSFIFFLLLGKLSDHAVDNGQKLFLKGADPGTNNLSIDEMRGRKGNHRANGNDEVGDVSFDFASKEELQKTLAHLPQATDHELNRLLMEEDIDTTAKNRASLREFAANLPAGALLAGEKSSYSVFGKVKFATKAEYDSFREMIHEYSDEQVDSLLKAKGEEVSWINRQLLKKLGKFDLKNKDDLKEITHAVIKSISLTMFLMMPLTAILLLLIFYRKKYYYEHLIFSIHIHTIFFLIFSLDLAIQVFLSEKVGLKLWPWMVLFCLFYLISSLKHNYLQSWGKTIFKFLLMSVPYFFVSFILVLAAVVWGFLA